MHFYRFWPLHMSHFLFQNTFGWKEEGKMNIEQGTWTDKISHKIETDQGTSINYVSMIFGIFDTPPSQRKYL